MTFEQAVGDANLATPTNDLPNSGNGGDDCDVSDSSEADTESDFE
jgi:hypothetical protein